MARKTGSHSDITGPRVRAAAQTLFARHGFAAVSMRQIAKDVGVQAGALYLYTKDKQSLLFDLMKGHLEELLEAWQLHHPNSIGPMEDLEAFVRFHIGFHADRQEAVFIAYMELRNLDDDNFSVVEGLRKQYENVLGGILKNGQDTGIFAVPDTKLATLAVIAMLTGVNTWYRDGGRLDRETVQSIYWDMVRNSVAA
ncbi:TetR/AcrR family transcriptional regulator [Cochlodiniinecator piscidefendens]|uniref:TetR/AcrR family transcriptional regulator n=1 Tax=Cochlodiniinecator piscidefendens TaxID=2715756 RepID=UPI00140904DA|nr:TetR/AcrR family transcriptional regulator [Cochlodiniinecator piscidefendens]